MLSKHYLNKLSGVLLSVSFAFMVSHTTYAAEAQPPEPNTLSQPEGYINSNQGLQGVQGETGGTVVNTGIAHPPEETFPVANSMSGFSLTAQAFANMPRTAAPGKNATHRVHEQGKIGSDSQAAQSGTTQNNSASAVNQADQQAPTVDNAASNVSSNVSSNVAGTQAKNFEGISDTGWIPPDTVMAVGKDYVIEAVNSGFAINNLRGESLKSYTSFSTFFNAVKPSGWSGTMFDPRLTYQPEKKQFIMLILGRDTSTQRSYNFIAISKTSNPVSGGWWLYRITANPYNSDAWADYASIGADTFGLYITNNLFYWSGGFKYAMLRTLNPAMYSGGSSDGWVWHNLKWPSGSKAATLQVAQPHTVNSNGETFFVNSYSGSGSQILLWKLGSGNRNHVSPYPTLTKTAISTTNTYYALGNNVNQPGSVHNIDGGDTRLMNAVYINRRVFTTLSTDTLNDGSRAGTLTVELNTDTSTKVWEHLLTSPNWYYTYPSVIVNGSNVSNVNVGLYMTATNTTTTYPSATYKIYTDRAAGSGGPFIIYKSGLASYYKTYGGTRNRWGDYSGSGYDWQCNGRMWGTAEYAKTGNFWGTRTLGVMMDGSATCPLGRPAKLTTVTPTGDITDTTPTYTWNASPDATVYRVYVNDSTGNVINTTVSATAAGCSSGTGTCSYTPATTLAGGNATWWVIGWNTNYGYGVSWSNGRSFKVVLPAPAPTTISPLGNTYDLTPTYRWNAVASADNYRLYVNNNGTNVINHVYTKTEANCSSGTGTCYVTPATSLSPTTAKWWVRATNIAGGYWSTSKTFAPIPAPSAVTLITPAVYTADNTPTYTWNADPVATWYKLYVNDSSGNKINQWLHKSVVGCSAGTGTCTYTSATVLGDGRAVWWVKTYNPTGYGPYSSAKVFYVRTPARPTGLAPIGAVVTSTPTYQWASVPTATWYKLIVNDSTGNKINTWYSSVTLGCSGGGTCSITPAVTINSGAATWKVFAHNSYGNGPLSYTKHFSVP